MAGCRCRSAAEVNMGYCAYVAAQNTALYTQPDLDSPKLEPLIEGQGFGRQSALNPQGSDHPPVGRVVNGFVRGYKRSTGISGWALLAHLEPDSREDIPALRGPAGLDFEVGRTRCRPRKRQRFPYRPTRRVKRRVKAREVYGRWNPRGVFACYLRRGEVVVLRKKSWKQGYVCVEHHRWGCVWVSAAGLERIR